MRANDLTGMIFGTLKVLKFDSERHENDKKLKKEGKINRLINNSLHGRSF